MTSIPDPPRRRSVVGVDTHKHTHVAVALNLVGQVVAELAAADSSSASRAAAPTAPDWPRTYAAAATGCSR